MREGSVVNVLMAGVLLAGCSMAPAVTDPLAAIAAAQRRFDEALIARDGKTLAGLLAADFVMIAPSGEPMSREEVLRVLSTPGGSLRAVHSGAARFEVSEGHTSVVTAETTHELADGSTTTYMNTVVWREEEGEWRVALIHGTRVAVRKREK
jgi:ketosteroid isomerase-like protein